MTSPDCSGARREAEYHQKGLILGVNLFTTEYSITNMSNKSQMKIVKTDLTTIYGEDFHFFEEKIIPNCYCGKCNSPYESTIVNYEIFLNDFNDIVLKGYCEKCKNPINRYLETGQVDEYQERIKKIRQNLKK